MKDETKPKTYNDEQLAAESRSRVEALERDVTFLLSCVKSSEDISAAEEQGIRDRLRALRGGGR